VCQSGRSQEETAGTVNSSLDSLASWSIGLTQADKGSAVPSNSLLHPPRSTPSSSVRSLKNGSDRNLNTKRRPSLERKLRRRDRQPALEHKLRNRGGRLTASNRTLSTVAEEDMESVMTKDSREAEAKSQVIKNLANMESVKKCDSHASKNGVDKLQPIKMSAGETEEKERARPMLKRIPSIRRGQAFAIKRQLEISP
jgi:hypothetical protein